MDEIRGELLEVTRTVICMLISRLTPLGSIAEFRYSGGAMSLADSKCRSARLVDEIWQSLAA